MTSPSTTAALRRLQIFAFPPALILFIAHGISSGRPFPALGLIPLAASAILAIMLHKGNVVALGSTQVHALSDTAIFRSDFLIAVFHLAFLAPSWRSLTRVYDEPVIVLGTYCTTFMMFDLGVHLLIILPRALQFLVNRSCNCPHCPHYRNTHQTSHFSSAVSEYTPLGGDDEQIEPDNGARDVEEGCAKSDA
ncbi:hypothetical protein LZ31DRAFT_558627 [Colletotrichum somersetense]|nr:hypothetical protein LZ31DRAFT_558627 [Colletotrichum somersetense]